MDESKKLQQQQIIKTEIQKSYSCNHSSHIQLKLALLKY